MTEPIKYDTAAAIDFLRRWYGDRDWVLTSIIPDGKTETRTFSPSRDDEAAEWIEARQGKRNLYFTPNPVRRAISVKPSKPDISAFLAFWVDLDPRAGEDSAEELRRIQTLLTTGLPAGVPVLSVLTCSGNGMQGFWRLKEPLSIPERTPENPEPWAVGEAYIRGLERLFGSDAVHNCDRIMRLPGTINLPDATKVKRGRKPALARLIEWNDTRHPLSAFQPTTVAAAPLPTASASQKVGLGDPRPVGTEDLRQWAMEAGTLLPDRPLALIATGDASAWAGDRSDMVFYVCCELLRARVPELLIASAIFDKANPISAHIYEKGGRNPWSYAQRQVQRAKLKNAEANPPVDRDTREAARRAHQVEENRRIGEGAATAPPAELIELDAALARFVFCSDGSRVVDVLNPHYDLPLHDWQATYAASKVTVARPPKVLAGGGTKDQEPASVPLAKVWMSHPERRTVITRTFKAGGSLVLPDPGGRLAVNSWRPFDRSLSVTDLDAAGLGLFLDHVAFLFGEDAPRFLDWLAHIEQKPGELPHTSWLHIARKFGMGRNWLASVLTRVWANPPNISLTPCTRQTDAAWCDAQDEAGIGRV